MPPQHSRVSDIGSRTKAAATETSRRRRLERIARPPDVSTSESRASTCRGRCTNGSGNRRPHDKTTRTALILTAINQTHSQLGSYLATGGGSAGGGGGDDLFESPSTRRTPSPQCRRRFASRIDSTRQSKLWWQKFGANRSQLVTAALMLYLVVTDPATGRHDERLATVDGSSFPTMGLRQSPTLPVV